VLGHCWVDTPHINTFEGDSVLSKFVVCSPLSPSRRPRLGFCQRKRFSQKQFRLKSTPKHTCTILRSAECMSTRQSRYGTFGWCVWKGYFVSSWSASSAPTPRNYTIIHLKLWSAQYGKLSDFKWAGHRLAHTGIFADGWSTASHKRNMTLLDAPTRTLLFYYKEIKQEIVHTLLLEEYGVLKKWVEMWTIGSGPLLCQRIRRRREETACKRRRKEISLVFVIVILHVLTYVVSNKLFWNWNNVVRFVS